MTEILAGLSHDSVNRFRLRERYAPKDLFDEVKKHIDLIGGTLSGDDTVIDKPDSEPSLTKLIGYFWSGKHHRVVKGIQLITLVYTDRAGKSVPVTYRLYNRFMVRTSEAIHTHFFCAIRAFTQLELMRASELIKNWYEVQRTLYLKVAREFILEHLKQKIELPAHN